VANTIGMPDYVLDAARSVTGVNYAVPVYSGGALVKLADGTYQAVNVVGLDDTSLFGRPQLLQGKIEDIYGENAFIVVKDPEFPKLEKSYPRKRITVQQYQAAYDQTVANYRETVLTAFQQVEDNLAGLRILTEVIEQQNAAIDSAGRNLREAQVRYKAGLDPYLNVITAQTALLNDQQAAVNFRAQQMVAGVQLIEALGGGWDASQIPSDKALAARQPRSTP
jgi:hypothetical protein